MFILTLTILIIILSLAIGKEDGENTNLLTIIQYNYRCLNPKKQQKKSYFVFPTIFKAFQILKKKKGAK